MKNGILHITKHKGKLADIDSVNVSCFNDFCDIFSEIPNYVCARCYGRRMESFRSRLRAQLEKNAKLLSTSALKPAELPFFIPGSYVRFNSFGELLNETHLENLYAICRKNPKVHFALWTKRDLLVKTSERRPKNLVLVYSEPLLDAQYPIVPFQFDYVYVVHSKNSGVKPCGDLCASCLRCYTKPLPGADRVIRQLIH